MFSNVIWRISKNISNLEIGRLDSERLCNRSNGPTVNNRPAIHAHFLLAVSEKKQGEKLEIMAGGSCICKIEKEVA